MQTVDVRVLLADDVDPEFFVEQLVETTRGSGAPLGAVELIPDGFGRVTPSPRVIRRPNVVWSGDDVSEDS